MTPTPGPWRWMNADALVADHGRRRAILTTPPMHSDGSLQTCGEDGRLRQLDPDEPNARLIAAAPELLAALKACVQVMVEHNAQHVEWDDAVAAIAKAEGR